MLETIGNLLGTDADLTKVIIGTVTTLLAGGVLAFKQLLSRYLFKRNLAKQTEMAIQLAEFKKQQKIAANKRAIREQAKNEQANPKPSRNSPDGPFSGVRKRYGKAKRNQ